MLIIRAAGVSDVPLLLRFSREFAEYERQPDAVVINEETLIRDGFGSQPKFRSLIAEWDGEAIGYARFFGFYSSLKGSGIFLEDLFVRKAFRGRGIGRALPRQVAEQVCLAGRDGLTLPKFFFELRLWARENDSERSDGAARVWPESKKSCGFAGAFAKS